MKTIELNEQEANVVFAALGELPGKVSFEAMHMLRKKFEALADTQTAPATDIDKKEKPKP